jgi:hypothetical protein
VNVPKRRLEGCANLTGGAYPRPTIMEETESVELVKGGQVARQIKVTELLPRRV